MSRWLRFGLAALVALGGVWLGFNAVTDDRDGVVEEGFGEGMPRGIHGALSLVEVIAVIDSVESLGAIQPVAEYDPLPGWEFDVVELLYVAEVPREVTDEKWHQAPGYEDLTFTVPVPSGRITAVDTARGPDLAAAAARGRLVVFLDAMDPQIDGEFTTPWRINLAVLDNPGGVEFVAPELDGMRDQFDEVIAALGDPAVVAAAEADPDSDAAPEVPEIALRLGANPRDVGLELDLLVAWVDMNRTYGVRNALMNMPAAASRVWRGPPTESAWETADPARRAVDPEITPQHVLDALEEWSILVDLPDSWPGGGYVEIRTPTGVVHAVNVDAGDHNGAILARSTEPWMIWHTAESGDGKGKLIATIANPPSSDAPYVLVTLNVDPDGQATATVRELTIEEAAEITNAWADDN